MPGRSRRYAACWASRRRAIMPGEPGRKVGERSRTGPCWTTSARHTPTAAGGMAARVCMRRAGRRAKGGPPQGRALDSPSWRALRGCGSLFMRLDGGGSWAGLCGRAETWRKPRRASWAPTLRSAKCTQNRSSITFARSMRRQRTTPSLARSGPPRTIVASSACCSGDRRGLAPGTLRSDSGGRPSSLKPWTQSRSVW